MENKNRFVETN